MKSDETLLHGQLVQDGKSDPKFAMRAASTDRPRIDFGELLFQDIA